MPTNPQPHHVVVVGAGVAGLAAVRALRGAPVTVTVIDASDHHTFQPLLYQVASASLAAEDITVRVRSLLRAQPHARFLRGRVVGLDPERKTVQLEGGEQLDYDSLLLAAGAESEDFGVAGVRAHAFPLKSVHDALAIRDQVLRSIEDAAHAAAAAAAAGRDALPADAEAALAARTVVVAGAGPTGVEMAGALAELLARARRDLPASAQQAPRVVLVEPTGAVLPSYANATQAYAARALEARGVELRLGASVASVDPASVTLTDGTTIASRTLVWAAGVRAHPLARALSVPLARGGRVPVTDRLHLAAHPDVFVVGDLAGPAGDGAALPQVAQVAMQMGSHAARVIRARLRGREAPAFRYADRGQMAIIGRGAGVAELSRRLGGARMRGLVGWLAWLALHLAYLPGAANRARVLATWLLELTQRDRAADLAVGRVTPTEARDTGSAATRAHVAASEGAMGWHRAA